MKQAITPRHLAGGIVLLIISLIVLVALSSCKTVHKASSQEKTVIDSSYHEEATLSKVDSSYSTNSITVVDSSTVTKDKAFETVKTITVKFDSVGHKTEQTTTVTTKGTVKSKEQKAIKVNDDSALDDHSKVNADDNKDGTVKKEAEKKENTVVKEPAATAWLSSIAIWFIVIGAFAGGVWFFVARTKRKVQDVKTVLENEIHS